MSAEAKDFSSIGSLHITISHPKCYPLKWPTVLILVVLKVLKSKARLTGRFCMSNQVCNYLAYV